MSSSSTPENSKIPSLQTVTSSAAGAGQQCKNERGFGERPDKIVESLGLEADWRSGTMTQPNQIRHHYPSD